MSVDRQILELLERLYHAVQKNEARLEKIERVQTKLLKEIIGDLADVTELSSIRVQFNQGAPMPVGPVTLTSVGQTVTATVVGFDENGNPFTGTIPTPTFSSSDNLQAVVTFDPSTDKVAAVANGVADITANLTSAEGKALSDTEAVTVDIPQVLSSIKVSFD